MKIVVISSKTWITGCIIGLLLCSVFWVISRNRKKRGHKEHDELQEWKIPSLGGGEENQQQSLIGKLDPRFKIFTLILFSFLVVFSIHFQVLIVYLLLAVVLFFLSKAKLLTLLRRVLPVFFFVLILAVIMPLTAPIRSDDLVIVFEPIEWFRLNLTVLLVVAKIGLKAFTVLLLMPIMLETSPYPVTIAAIKRLGLPESIAQMLILSYRYIFVFRDEASRMFRSMKLRGFKLKTNIRTFYVLGNFLGILFVRSYERTQRIYEAMVAKGYKGTFPTLATFKTKRLDIVFTAVGLTVIIAGIVVDRIIL